MIFPLGPGTSAQTGAGVAIGDVHMTTPAPVTCQGDCKNREVLMFWWLRKSKLCHFANYNVLVVALYDVIPGPGASPGLIGDQ